MPSATQIFQSTLSVRRATILYGDTHDSSLISIHALRKESDISCVTSSSRCGRFQSTLSVRRATFTPTLDLAVSIFQSTLSVRRATPEHPEGHARNMISIHALRKESDRLWNHHASHHQRFQSTLSVRRATRGSSFSSAMAQISIHALRKESDRILPDRPRPGRNFNPRSP